VPIYPLDLLEKYGKAERTWGINLCIPTKEVPVKMKNGFNKALIQVQPINVGGCSHRKVWTKCKTPGIRYRLHATRKHGVSFDKYFTIRYGTGGKEKPEGLGWSSDSLQTFVRSAIIILVKLDRKEPAIEFTRLHGRAIRGLIFKTERERPRSIKSDKYLRQ
jgi:hypothetical protein